MHSEEEAYKAQNFHSIKAFSPKFQTILADNAEFVDSPNQFCESAMTQRALPIAQRKSIIYENVEEFHTDYEILKKCKPIGNSLGIFLSNLMNGKHLEKAKAIVNSLTEDVKILVLTESKCTDINITLRPILSLFKNPNLAHPMKNLNTN